MAAYGRNRQSIADIQDTLHEIFNEHPQSHLDDSGEPVLPADSLVDVFRAFSELFQGVELMTDEELGLLKNFLATNPGLDVTPQMLIGFIAMRTTNSPRHSPQGSPTDSQINLPDRGRTADRDALDQNSRSSSSDSVGTSVNRPSSRRSSLGPPKTPSGPSPFDTSRRQRSTPLGNNAPSSWNKRPAPASRRKSDAGSHGRALSDSESFSASPSAFNRTPAGRTRAPSNPTTPSDAYGTPMSPSNIGSPSFDSSISRPHSRTRSLGYHYSSPDLDSPSRMMSPPPDLDMSGSLYSDTSLSAISSLPMPRSSDSDSDGEDSALGLVMDRSAASSTVSLEPFERLEALQRANADLARKLVDAERTLQNKLSDHELELEEMQSRLEEVKSELSATKREEKELRTKERTTSNQMATLESEIAKLQRSLENARTSYQSLQKQYQEQCAESERYRNTLRLRDQEFKDLQESAALQQIESAKFTKEHDSYEERIAMLENDLSIAQQAHAQLDVQKQENLMLKETIDRMRFDMDEMRNNATYNLQGGASGGSSAQNSVSKSLGAELLGKMKGTQWGMESDDEEEDDSSETMFDDEVEGESDGTEGEDVIQTIITRTKRKVAGRANKVQTRSFEETKEYSDAYTQHELSEFTSSSTSQTDPTPEVRTVSFSIQTSPPPVTFASAIQTDPEPVPIPRMTTDMEVQTEDVEPEVQSRSPSPHTTIEEDEAMASSSSTVLPPTPKAKASAHLHSDLPPAYHQVTEQDQDAHDMRIAAETLRKWHNGATVPFEPAAAGVSEDAIEEWNALKEELGLECLVIDKIISSSERTGQPRPTKDGKPSSRKSRFYNIYNTYVYGGGSKEGGSSFTHGPAAHILLGIGASALVFFAMSPYMIPHYVVPGGPTYYDRVAWASFNSMQAAGEGFSSDGTAAVWSFIGRVGGGAARMARGWPT